MARGRFNRPWFEAQLRDRKWTQRRFAEKTKIDAGRISVLFSGERPMLLHEAQTIGDVLGVAPTTVLKHAGIHVDPPRMVKVTGHVASDGSVSYVASDTEDEVECPPHVPHDAFALQVRSHMSRLAIFDRWIVIVSGLKVHPQALLRQLVLLGLRDQKVLLAHIREGYKANTINVHHPESVQENVSALWAMRVLWMRPDDEPIGDHR